MATRKRDRIVGNVAAAEIADMNVDTFRGLVSRGYAPQPIDREIVVPPRGGSHALPVYDRAELEKYRRTRRRWGRGEHSRSHSDRQPPG